MTTFMGREPELRALIREGGETVQGDLQAWTGALVARYELYARDLPPESLWRERKIEHAWEAERDARKSARGLGMDEVETDVLAFLLFAHDIGRMVEATRMARNEPRPPWLHGRDSSDIVEDVMGPYAEKPLSRVLLSAIEHHSDAQPVTLESVDGSRPAYALATMLRDLDKREGFQQAKRYTEDAVFKEKQRLQNWPEQAKDDPYWGRELGRIDPDPLLARFCGYELLPRAECRSYECYMLQLLAWCFDIVHPENLERTLQEGGPMIVRDYIDKQLLDRDQKQRFRDALRGWKDGILAIR